MLANDIIQPTISCLIFGLLLLGLNSLLKGHRTMTNQGESTLPPEDPMPLVALADIISVLYGDDDDTC